MKLLYLALISVLLISCRKADIEPVSTKSAIKTDSLKNNIYSQDTNTSNPNYWYNGTTGTALIQVTCSNCTALATIGTETIPFLFNANGVGLLKYSPVSGLLVKIAICPTGTEAIKADVLGANGTPLYSYAGIISSNWSAAYIIK